MCGLGGLARSCGGGLLAAVLAFSGVSGPAAAREPDGPIRFDPVWIEADRSVRDAALRGAGAELRLDVSPYLEIVDATLVVRAPRGIGAQFADGGALQAVTSTVDADGSTVLRVPLGRLQRSGSYALRVGFTLDGDAGAVVPLVVEGLTVDGRPIRDGCGVAVGVPSASPHLRHGALEFRSTPARPDEIPGAAGARGP